MGPRLSDLCPGEVTVLSHLSERRDSSSSTLSSAYTLSRRSSGIVSQCFSSRRSSGASQYGGSSLGAGRPNNVSSADSYDPISADLSRRSSEASQGAPVSLSLTPAQHYRLKAKYAAATGGAPPTPLPNMERMSLRNRVALMGDASGSAAIGYPYGHAPTVPRRCSDGGYANVSMMPHEAPGRLQRRASDPVRRAGPEPLASPQRFNSLNHMTSQQPIGLSERQQLSLQGYVHSDGPPYMPRPPSISENVVMETLACGQNGGEDELMLLDDMVQYITSQPEPAQNNPENRFSQHTQGFHGNSLPLKQQQQSCFYQRRAAMADANMNTSPARQATLRHVSPGTQQHGQHGPQGHPPSPGGSGRTSLPLQWNEVSSGSGSGGPDGSPGQPKQNFGRQEQENLHLQQHPSPCQNLGQNRQVRPLSQNLGLTTASATAATHLRHHQHHPGQGGGSDCPSQRMDLVQTQSQQQLPLRCQPQQGYSQGLASAHVNGNAAQMRYQPCGGLAGSGTGPLGVGAAVGVSGGERPSQQPSDSTAATAAAQNSRVRPQLTASQSHAAFQANQENYFQMNASRKNPTAGAPDQLPLLHANQGLMPPRPPTEPKLSSQRLIGPNPTQQHPAFPQSAFGPDYSCSSSEASPKKPGTVAHDAADANDNSVFYTGQISCTMGDADDPLVTMASPGTNQVSSTVDSIHGLEQPQIDFDTMLDDGDHSSLMSGTISPSILRNLSQNSSRLTTPRNSVTLPSVPAGIGNMAIGDMTSMLSTLAEESKFLNMMS